jgi:hypothetical protein
MVKISNALRSLRGTGQSDGVHWFCGGAILEGGIDVDWDGGGHVVGQFVRGAESEGQELGY